MRFRTAFRLLAAFVAINGTLASSVVALAHGEAHEHAVRLALETTERQVLEQLGHPTYTLPLLAGGADLSGLYEVATALSAQGAA